MAEKRKGSEKSLVSIVIPVYNERDCIEELFRRLEAVFGEWSRPYEIIFVDDGSTDGTSEILNTFPEQDPSVRVIRFLRNFGQQAGVTAGFENARGEIAVVMDGDLQVQPEDIPRLVEKIDEGYDIAAGYRDKRPEGWLTRRLPSWLANKFFSFILGLPYRDMGCGLQAYRKRFLEGPDRFTPMYGHAAIFAVWRGGKFVEVPVRFSPRKSGRTKYGWINLIGFFLDILITFSMKPIQLTVFFLLGAVFAAGSAGLLLLLTAIWIGGISVAAGWWFLGLFLGLAALQMVTAGIQYERINRINNRIQNHPVFVIDEIIEHRSKGTSK